MEFASEMRPWRFRLRQAGMNHEVLLSLAVCGGATEFQMKRFFVFALLSIVMAMASAGAQAEEQTFAKPKQGPYRIDWCYQWGSQCGQPAADRFCMSKGFARSNDFVEAENIGSLTPTIVQGTGQVCNGPDCDGFTYVTCQKPDLPPPPMPPLGPPSGGGDDTKIYFKPKIGGVRLNYCLSIGMGCGQEAADAFCDMKGFEDASDFNQSPPLPPNIKTRFIGSGKKCYGPVCYGFQSVECENPQ
jgi:hypothetical protein